MQLLIETADEINLPDDPEFRSAFVAYIEWGRRIAVLNSNTTEVNMNPDEPMPKGVGKFRANLFKNKIYDSILLFQFAE